MSHPGIATAMSRTLERNDRAGRPRPVVQKGAYGLIGRHSPLAENRRPEDAPCRRAAPR
jgi:hypothetical protein